MTIIAQTVNDMKAKAIAVNEEDYNTHLEILEMLESVEGKQFNKRTFSEKVLKGKKFKVHYGNYYITDSKGQDHLIGYEGSSSVVDSKLYNDKYSSWANTGAKERIKKLNDLNIFDCVMSFGWLEESFNNMVEAFKTIEASKLDSFNNPLYYELLKVIGTCEKGSKILNDMASFSKYGNLARRELIKHTATYIQYLNICGSMKHFRKDLKCFM
jgi:hypothetical protein